jgi:hypothetical protein
LLGAFLRDHFLYIFTLTSTQNAYLLVFNRYRHELALIDDLQKWSEDYSQVKMLYIESVIAKKKYKKVVFSKGWDYQAPFLKNYL